MLLNVDWPEYSRVHTSRSNLLIHLIAVPLFVVASISLVKYVVRGDWASALIAIFVAFVTMAAQGRGHRKEPLPPRPFSGPANFLRRWFTEQFFLFPTFLLSGRWWRQYVAAGEGVES
jgi:hypothetical protein